MKSIFEAIDQADHGLVWQLVQSKKSELGQIDDVTGLSPLALAAELGRTESVRTLIEAGAKVDFGGVSTPLESAVAEGHIEIARMLIDAGADVNKRVGEGYTPLMSAAFLGDVEIVRLLLEKGAQPRARNLDGETAIDLAAGAGFEALSKEIRGFSHKEFEQERERQEAERRRKQEEELQKRREERRARIVAARAGRSNPGLRRQPTTRKEGSGYQDPFSSTAKPLFTAEPTPQESSPFGAPAKKPRQRSQAADAFDALFGPQEAGTGPIDPNLLEGIDRFEALLQTAPVRARRMIDFGDLSGEELNAKRETPLMLAAAAGEAEIVRVLLAAGVEVDLDDGSENRETALLKAVQTPSRGRLETIELLVDAGADLERRHGEAKRTPLMFAAQADVYTPDPYARVFGDTTRHLIKLGAKLDTEDARGDTLWKIIKRAAIGAPTSSPFRRRLFDMQKVIESYTGGEQ